MFKPKTKEIKEWASKLPAHIEKLEQLLTGNVSVYIDYANVRPWSSKLKWNIDIERLKLFLDSFDNIRFIKFYDGTLQGDKISENAQKYKEKIFREGFKTKAVKIMRQSVDYTSIKPVSMDLLEKFIRKCLLREYKQETIEYLNLKFKEMNQRGVCYIEDRKCNFDVEIGRDMLLDYERSNIDTFVLWSGDSDFYDPLNQLLIDGKQVILFATAGRVAKELNYLTESGLKIFDIKRIREFICWKKQI